MNGGFDEDVFGSPSAAPAKADAGFDPEVFGAAAAPVAAEPVKRDAEANRSLYDRFKGVVGDTLAGGAAGAANIGSTILTPFDAAARALGVPENPFIGRTDRRQATKEALVDLGADTDSLAYGAGKIATEIAGTAGAPGLIAKPLIALSKAAPALAPIAQAIGSAGMKTGINPAGILTAGRAADVGARVAGGAIAGGAAAGLVNPDDAATGAVVGGLLPPALQLAGKGGQLVGAALRGPAVPDATRSAAAAAIGEGYKLPPSMVKPSLLNRTLEGFAGKLSTAQNASAANQGVTNSLAAKALGLPADATLDAIALKGVRDNAGRAYEAIGQTGTITPPAAYGQALDRIAAPFLKTAQAFPNAKPSPVLDLVESMRSPSFDAASAVEKIKQLRTGADDAYRAGNTDVGRASKAAAQALEDSIETHLQSVKQPELLDEFRAARKLIAKSYSVEKALNQGTGSVDARKLAAQLNRGKPLSGELKDVAEFAARFPKAAQPIEGMGSLPQTSPLDWALATGSSIAAGQPLPMLGVLARPAARAAVLSPVIQRNLARPGPILALPPRPLQPALPMLGRVAPVGYSAMTDR